MLGGIGTIRSPDIDEALALFVVGLLSSRRGFFISGVCGGYESWQVVTSISRCRAWNFSHALILSPVN